MMLSRRLLAVLAAVALPVTFAAPTTAAPATTTEVDPPFLSVSDARDDLTDLAGSKVDVPGARGLDVFSARHRVRDDGRLVIISKHRNLTRANTRTNPDAVAIGGPLAMFAAYVDATPNDSSDSMYTLSFDKHRKVSVTAGAGAPVPCPSAAERSRINLERDIVRYVVPASCLGGVKATRTVAQVIRYKVTGRNADGVEVLEMMGLDQNDRPLPRVALR